MKQTLLLTLLFCGFLCGSTSHALDFYDNSTEAPHISLIEHAQTSIDIEIYTMEDAAIRSAITSAQTRGVKVRIVQEPAPVGASCKIFNAPSTKDNAACTDLRAFVSDVVAKGGTYLPYNKTAFCDGKKTCYEHGKIMIVDGSTALVSTGNFDSTSICDKNEKISRCNRDFSVVTNDADEVQTLETIFAADLAGVTYDLKSLVDAIPSATLTVSPYSLAPLVTFIQTAQISLQIENQYLKDADLNQAIIAAAKRGVNVQVMVSSICAFGKPTASAAKAAATLANEFSEAGVSARAFTNKMKVNGKEGYLHAKTIVVDHQTAWVGSVNGSTTALQVNREYGIFFQDAAPVSALSKAMSTDFSDAASTTLLEDSTCN